MNSSINTTSQKIEAREVANDERLQSLPRHFGRHMLDVEYAVYQQRDGDTFGRFFGEFRTGEDHATGIRSCRAIGDKGSTDAIGSAILVGVGARNRPFPVCRDRLQSGDLVHGAGAERLRVDLLNATPTEEPFSAAPYPAIRRKRAALRCSAEVQRDQRNAIDEAVANNVHPKVLSINKIEGSK